MNEPRRRWSDEELEGFRSEFREHVAQEKEEKEQQSEIHEALFRKENPDENIPPGVIQLLTQVSSRLKTMEIAADRQKRFIGGVTFAFSCMGFLFTDSARQLLAWFKGL